MMLCKADFEELFPEVFAPERHRAERTAPAGNRPVCIARWEDDGGALRRGAGASRTPVSGFVRRQ